MNNQEKITAQKEYTDKNNLPLFAPRNGKCWCCGNNIYDKISLEKASNDLITGCPFCFRSFCD